MKQDETYNGWTNWDTWEANNILTNDEYLYKQAQRAYKKDQLIRLILDWYQENEITPEMQVDLNEVNWAEIEKSLGE